MEMETERSARRWFRAGESYLAIDTSTTATHPAIQGLEDAVLLGNLDPLLQELASWLGRDLDWRPVEIDDDPPLISHRAVFGEDDEQVVELVLEDAITATRSLPDSASGQAFRVQTYQINSRLRLDRFSLSDDDFERLGPGSLVLLESSFAEQWLATLELEDDNGADARVYVQPASGFVYFHSWLDGATREQGGSCGYPDAVKSSDAEDAQGARGAQGARHRIDVYLDRRLSVDLAQWREAEHADGTSTATDGFMRRRLRMSVDDGPAQPALLQPLGDGYAARLLSEAEKVAMSESSESSEAAGTDSAERERH